MKNLITFFNSTANDNAAVQVFLQDILDEYFGDMNLRVQYKSSQCKSSGHFILPVPKLPQERVHDCHDLYDRLYNIFGGLNDKGFLAVHRIGNEKITEAVNHMEVTGSPVFLLGKIHEYDHAAFAALGDRLVEAQPGLPTYDH